VGEVVVLTNILLVATCLSCSYEFLRRARAVARDVYYGTGGRDWYVFSVWALVTWCSLSAACGWLLWR